MHFLLDRTMYLKCETTGRTEGNRTGKGVCMQHVLTEFRAYLHRYKDTLPFVEDSLVLSWTSEQPQDHSKVFIGHCTPDWCQVIPDRLICSQHWLFSSYKYIKQSVVKQLLKNTKISLLVQFLTHAKCCSWPGLPFHTDGWLQAITARYCQVHRTAILLHAHGV